MKIVNMFEQTKVDIFQQMHNTFKKNSADYRVSATDGSIRLRCMKFDVDSRVRLRRKMYTDVIPACGSA